MKVITGHVGLRTCVHSWASVQILICLVITFTVRKPFPFFPFVGTIVFDERERERESYCTHERKKECPKLFSLCIVKSCESHAFQNTYKNNTQHCYSKTENCFGCIQNTVFKRRKFLIFDSNTPTKHTFFLAHNF